MNAAEEPSGIRQPPQFSVADRQMLFTHLDQIAAAQRRAEQGDDQPEVGD